MFENSQCMPMIHYKPSFVWWVYHQSVDETSTQIMDELCLIYGPNIPDPTNVFIPDLVINPSCPRDVHG